MTCSCILIHRSKTTPRFVTDPFGIIEEASICNAGVFKDLTQCGDAKYIIFIFYYPLVLEDFESPIAEYQQYNVLSSSRKKRNLTHCQDPVIYTAMCHQHTGDI